MLIINSEVKAFALNLVRDNLEYFILSLFQSMYYNQLFAIVNI